MGVSPGPTFTIDDGGGGSENQEDGSIPRVMEPPQFFTADGSSESSSSIGTPDDSEDEEQGEDEAQSRLNLQIGLDCLDSLEESLSTRLVPSFSFYFFLSTENFLGSGF